MSGSVTTIDQDVLHALRQDLEAEEIGLLVATFFADLDRLGAALAEAAMAGDAQGFARHAHRLAGAAGAIGAQALHHAARCWIVPADGADLSAAAQGIARLAHEARAMLAPLHCGAR